MQFAKPNASLFVPDGSDAIGALGRITHLGIGAHPDDLEFMTWHGILSCFQSQQRWFGGVTVCDGRGSSRTHGYANYSDDEMQQVRLQEQQRAAVIGEYSAQICLMYSSQEVRDRQSRQTLISDLQAILKATQLRVLFTHNPVDRHDSHIAIFSAVVSALRGLPKDFWPEEFYGCEVWRSLDWLPGRVGFDVSAHENLSMALMGVYDSQISGGKRYDLATAGRKRANATYHDPYHPDAATSLEYAMDLMPLLRSPEMPILEFVQSQIQQLYQDAKSRLEPFL